MEDPNELLLGARRELPEVAHMKLLEGVHTEFLGGLLESS